MTTMIQVFQNDAFGSVRTLEEDGKVLFCAKDVAKVLGYTNTRDAISRHCKGVVKRDGVSETTNQHGKTTMQHVEMAFIPEYDVYRLAAHSRLPAAQKFEKWLYEEVLPSIRKHGGYVPDMAKLLEDATKAVLSVVMPIIRNEMDTRAETAGNGYAYEEPKKRRRLRPPRSSITVLPGEIRQEVEDMLFSNVYTYNDISQILRMHYDLNISKSSIGRYAACLFEQGSFY